MILKPEECVFFFSTKDVFSQWHRSYFAVRNITYNCAEQYMMAEKARLFGDDDALQKIMHAEEPRDQKALGKTVRNFDIRVWTAAAQNIVILGNIHKFSQNPEMLKELLDTGNKMLVEASPYDCIWGIGVGISDPNRFDNSKWRGKNLLGEALMYVRSCLSSCGIMHMLRCAD